jgi:hypothetical protein
MRKSLYNGVVIGVRSRMAHIGNCLGRFIQRRSNMNIVSFLVNRLKEPSTYAGFAGIALAFGLSDAEWSAIATAVAGLAGLAAMFLIEAPAQSAE